MGLYIVTPEFKDFNLFESILGNLKWRYSYHNEKGFLICIIAFVNWHNELPPSNALVTWWLFI